jgi:hypothetical protein
VSKVVSFTEGFTNTGHYPYVLANLDCGHAYSVVMRDTRGVCCGCEGPMSHKHGESFKRCSCGTFMTGSIDSPKPHDAADRLTKAGDDVACEHCAREAAQAEWLRGLDPAIVHHGRYRHGSYHLYRLDPTSPSSFFLIGSVTPTPAVEAILRAKGISPLSPTEVA